MSEIGGWDSEDNDEVAGDDAGDQTPARRYETLDEFVGDFLLDALWIDVSGQSRIWCPQWWRHSGAIMRLDALHRAFEAMRLDPGTGLSAWVLQHADPHMVALTNPQGVFKGCSVDGGHDADRDRLIISEPAPSGMFQPDD